MLQRVQTLFLLFVLLGAIIIIFLPFQTIVANGEGHVQCLAPGCNKEMIGPLIYLPMALNAVIILLSAITIFQYKHRPRQARLANMLAILNVLIVGLFFLLSFTKEEYKVDEVKYGIGSFVPALSIIAALLAAYYIRKDEKLVRSADRIR